MYDEYWLDICYHLHITPEEQDRMPVRRYQAACAAVEKIRQELKK